MNDEQRTFLEELLDTPSPSGYEVRGQRVWVEYVSRFADEVHTDEYGNAVAIVVGDGDGPEIAVSGHADEIGFIVRGIDDDGFVHLAPIGGSDRTVSKGQHVTIHGSDGPVDGVIGQTAIHLRDPSKDEFDDITEQCVDVGASDGEAAREIVEVGDPITFSSTFSRLQGTRIAARGIDNRVGTWTAAETLRLVSDRDPAATVCAVSTVQEEVGLSGARMVGYDLEPDAAIAVDVTHATDHPGAPSEKSSDLDLGAGPVVARGSGNHPLLVDRVRAAADDAGIDYQLQATGIRTGTDADAFYTSRGGIPSLNVSIPNRYMHTPVEVVDTDDLVDAAEMLAAFAADVGSGETFAVDV